MLFNSSKPSLIPGCIIADLPPSCFCTVNPTPFPLSSYECCNCPQSYTLFHPSLLGKSLLKPSWVFLFVYLVGLGFCCCCFSSSISGRGQTSSCYISPDRNYQLISETTINTNEVYMLMGLN